MEVRILLLLFILKSSFCDDKNDFIIDYFSYKNTSYVVGFTCDNENDNIRLVKNFNSLGISISLSYLDVPSLFYLLLKTEYRKLGVFFNSNCHDDSVTRWIFSEASATNFYDEQHFWLVLGSNLNTTLKNLNDNGFGLSTDFVVANPMLAGYELYDVYNPWKMGGGQINVTYMGFWTRSTGLNISLKQSKFSRRSNLHGITVQASFFGSKYRSKNVDLEDYLQDYSSRTKDGLSKFGYIILVHFADMFNITFLFGEVQKWTEGDSVGPLSRALMKHEIQFTGSPIVMTNERSWLTKFVYPTWPFRTCFLFRNPQPQDIKIGEILHPFTNESWFVTLACLILLAFILSISLKYEKKELSQTRYSNSFLLVTGSFCQQGTNMNMQRISSRIIFIHMLIFSILVYTFYSASIVSTRLNEPIFKINDSLNELGKIGLKLASEPMIYFNFIMNRIPQWERKSFYEDHWLKISESERFMYPEYAIPLVQMGGFAYHTHPDTSYPTIDRTFSYREICELMEVHVQHPIYATLAVTHNSTFFEMSKIGFAWMSEVGIRQRQLERWTSSKPRCRKDIMNVSSTDIYEFAPHLIILFIGQMLALIILIIEKIIYEYIPKKQHLHHKTYDDSHHYTSMSFILVMCRLRKDKIQEEVFHDIVLKMIRISLIYIFAIIGTSGSEWSDFIIDYFASKHVPDVVALTCSDFSENARLVKRFNKLGIRTVIRQLNVPMKFERLIESTYWNVGVFVDFVCLVNKTESYTQPPELLNYKYFDEQYHWLIVSANLTNVTNFFDDGAFGLSTDFVVASPSHRSNDSNEYDLFDIYNPWKANGGKLIVTKLGTWRKSKGFYFISLMGKIERRSNFRGMKMKASFFGSPYRPPNMTLEDYLQDYSTRTRDGLSKFGYVILTHFSEMFNITFEFGEVKKWLEGDTKGPLTQALLTGEIDITGSPVVMTVERLHLTKFVYPTWPFRTCFIFRNPQPKDIKVYDILRPFEVKTWYGTVFCFLLIVFIFASTLKQEKSGIATSRFINAILITAGAICQQGTNFGLEKISSRIVFINIMIFSILIFNYYSASIVSVRLNEPIFKINDSLNQLGKTNLKVASEPMIYFDFLLTRNDWETKTFNKNTWSMVPKEQRFMYPDKGMPLVKEGGFAYHAHPEVAYPFIHRTFNFREICELMEVHLRDPVFATFSVTYNNTFVELAKIGFARMSEVGLRNRQLMRWTSPKPKCRKDVLTVSSTDIYEFAPFLIILFCGLILSTLILIFEIAYMNCSESKKKSKCNCIVKIIELLSR